MRHRVYAPACPVSFVTLSVDSVLQCLASLEARDLGGADFNRLTSLRVATGTRSTLHDSESSNTCQNNNITLIQSTPDGLENGVESIGGSSLGKIGTCRNGIHQCRLDH